MKRQAKWAGAGLALGFVIIGLVSTVLAPPAGADVSGFLAVWMHGTGARIEYPDRLDQILYRAFHTRIDGNANSVNWVHFPITTPVVGAYRSGGTGSSGFSAVEMNYRRYHLEKVFVSFRSGSVDARVTSVHVYDGPKRIASFDNLNLYGEHYMNQFVLPGAPEVEQGVCISLGVDFGASGERWIELQSVGADFYYQED
jgi:hypothetical protein